MWEKTTHLKCYGRWSGNDEPHAKVKKKKETRIRDRSGKVMFE